MSLLTFPAWDLKTLAPLDPLPYRGTTFGRSVNQPGSWAGALLLSDERVQKLAWNPASQTGKTLLCVDMHGTLIWGGVIWTRKYKKSSKLLTVGAMELGSYFRARLQAADYTSTWGATGEKPMLIVKRIVEDALAVQNVAGGITLSIHEEGVSPNLLASYPGTSLQTLESITSTLSQMGFGAGFDYSFDVAYKADGSGLPEVVMNLWYPRQGRLYNQSGIVLLDKDCTDWEYPEDSTQQATEIVESGSGSGNIVPATSAVSLPGYPLLQRAMSRSQIISEETLAAIALGDLGLYCYPVVTPWLELPLPGPLEPGEFSLGDDLLWRVDPVAGGGENTNPRFPNGVEFEWRIDTWTVAPADAGLTTLHLDLTVPPISTIPPPAPPL